MEKWHDSTETLVIGLGRFGSSVALNLEQLGREILAVEIDPRKVTRWQGRIPLVEADATNMDALEQLGARDFATAVVGVGTSLEASVLITANLVDLGMKTIWAKATSREHGKILHRIGAHKIVYPEYDAGARTAHLVNGGMLDYIEMDESGFSIVKIEAPQQCHDRYLTELDLENQFGIHVLGVMRPGQAFDYANAQSFIHRGDIIIASGHSEDLERFSQLR